MRRRDGSLARIPGGVTARRRGSTPPPPSSTSPAAQLQRSSSSSRRPTAVPSFLAWTSSTETPSSPTTAATTPRTRNLKKRRMIPKQTNTQKWTPPPGAGNLENISDALHAETLALLNVLNATAKMGFNQVIFEMDSAVLKQAISSEDYDLAPLGALFQEIKFQLRVAFENVNPYVCHRSCNNVAHVLAAHGASLGDGKYEIWLGQFPELVLNSVAGDLTSRSL